MMKISTGGDDVKFYIVVLLNKEVDHWSRRVLTAYFSGNGITSDELKASRFVRDIHLGADKAYQRNAAYYLYSRTNVGSSYHDQGTIDGNPALFIHCDGGPTIGTMELLKLLNAKCVDNFDTIGFNHNPGVDVSGIDVLYTTSVNRLLNIGDVE